VEIWLKRRAGKDMQNTPLSCYGVVENGNWVETTSRQRAQMEGLTLHAQTKIACPKRGKVTESKKTAIRTLFAFHYP
jgi:hypothetical protein